MKQARWPMMANDGQSGQIHSCRQTSDIPVLVLRSMPERHWKTRCRNRLWGISTWRCCAHRRCRCLKKRGNFFGEWQQHKATAVGFGAWQMIDFFHAHFMHLMGWEYLRSWTVVTTWGSYDINTLISRVKAAGVGSPWQGGVQVLDSAGVNVHLENQWKSTFNDLSWNVPSYDSIWKNLLIFSCHWPISTATGAFDRWITTRSTRLGFLSGGAMCRQFFLCRKSWGHCWTTLNGYISSNLQIWTKSSESGAKSWQSKVREFRFCLRQCCKRSTSGSQVSIFQVVVAVSCGSKIPRITPQQGGLSNMG